MTATQEMTTTKQSGSGLQLRTDPRQIQFKHLLESEGMMRSLQSALPKHLSAGRMIRVVLGAMQRTPALLSCTPESVLLAIMQSAALGMEPDGILGQGYLIPYGKQCQFIIGYRGLCQLARQSGQVVNIWAEVVYEKDHFDYDLGLAPTLRHKRNDEVADPGPLKYAYACARFKDGSTQFVVLNRREVEKAKSSSASARSSSSPWTTHEAPMWQKTAVRRLCKMLPLSVEVQTQIHVEDQLDLGQQPMRLPDLPALPPIPESMVAEGEEVDAGERPQTTAEPRPDFLELAGMDIKAALTPEAIDQAEDALLQKAENEAECNAVSGMATERREALKALAGTKAKQKTLA